MVDLDAALGGQLLDVAVGQADAEVVADRDDDDVGREAEAGEGGAGVERRGDGFSWRPSGCWKAVTANATASLERV